MLPHMILEEHYRLVSVLRSLRDKVAYLERVKEDKDKRAYVGNITAKIEAHLVTIKAKQAELDKQRVRVDNLFMRGE